MSDRPRERDAARPEHDVPLTRASADTADAELDAVMRELNPDLYRLAAENSVRTDARMIAPRKEALMTAGSARILIAAAVLREQAFDHVRELDQRGEVSDEEAIEAATQVSIAEIGYETALAQARGGP